RRGPFLGASFFSALQFTAVRRGCFAFWTMSAQANPKYEWVRTIFTLFKLLPGDLPRTKARQHRRIRRPRDTTLHCGQQSRVLRRMFRSLSRAVRLAM